MSPQPASTSSRAIVWPSVITVISAAILIGAEVFGAAFAGGWALAILFGLDDTGAHILQAVLFGVGVLDHGGVHPRRAAHRAVLHAARVTRVQRKRCGTGAKALTHLARNLNVCSCSSSRARAENALCKHVLGKFVPSLKKMLRSRIKTLICSSCPISHVPVVVCQSVGIRTRGRTAAKG